MILGAINWAADLLVCLSKWSGWIKFKLCQNCARYFLKPER